MSFCLVYLKFIDHDVSYSLIARMRCEAMLHGPYAPDLVVRFFSKNLVLSSPPGI